MAPFRYDDPYNPSRVGGSIGDLLARSGVVGQTIGASLARAGEQIGSSVADAPVRWMEAAREARAAEQATREGTLTDLQVEQARETQRLTKARERLGAALMAHAETTEDGHLRYDVAGFQQAVSGDPDLASIAHEPLDAMQRSNDQYQQWTEGRFATKSALLKSLYAQTAEAGGTSDDFDVLALPLVRGGALEEADLGSMARRLREIPDAAARIKLLRAAGGVKPDLMTVAPGSSVVDKTDPSAGAVFTAPPDAKTEAEIENLKADNARADKQLEELFRHNRATEATARRTGELSGTQWAKGPDGIVRLYTPSEIRSLGASQPDTADMRNKQAGKATAAIAVGAVRRLGDGIFTHVGPAQRAAAIERGVEAVFGTDPEFRTYQDSRMALAGTLAVEQQGSRVSDADVRALWLPMVPDAYRDTKESYKLKWQLIDAMRGVAAPKADNETPEQRAKRLYDEALK